MSNAHKMAGPIGQDKDFVGGVRAVIDHGLVTRVACDVWLPRVHHAGYVCV